MVSPLSPGNRDKQQSVSVTVKVARVWPQWREAPTLALRQDFLPLHHANLPPWCAEQLQRQADKLRALGLGAFTRASHLSGFLKGAWHSKEGEAADGCRRTRDTASHPVAHMLGGPERRA